MQSRTARLEPYTDFLWSREDYAELIRRGVFTEDDRLELLNGKLIIMAPQHSRHATAYTLVSNYLAGVFKEGFFIRTQLPIALDCHSEPEPDIAVVRGTPRDFVNHHPGPDSIVLLVEISDSSLNYDRGAKLAAYAAADIPEYWIVNLDDARVEVFMHPSEERYKQSKTFQPENLIAPLGFESQQVSVAELLP